MNDIFNVMLISVRILLPSITFMFIKEIGLQFSFYCCVLCLFDFGVRVILASQKELKRLLFYLMEQFEQCWYQCFTTTNCKFWYNSTENPMEPELRTVVSCPVGAGTQTWVLWLNSHCSQPLSALSIPLSFDFSRQFGWVQQSWLAVVFFQSLDYIFPFGFGSVE